MSVSGLGPIFLVACMGGVFAELLKWYKLREIGKLPTYARQAFYWIVTILMVLAGGVVAILYGDSEKSALLVAQLGATTPLLIRGLADGALAEQPSSERRRAPGYEMKPGPANGRTREVLRFLAAR